MHIAESLSLVAGKRINKIDILEKIYPLNVDNYIVIQPYSKPSKSYDYWEIVLDILRPILNKSGISVIQIGAKDEKPLTGCIHLQGLTSVNQCAYVIKNSKLVFGADSFGLHLAGHYNLPLVGLYSNNYIDCVKPFFGNKDKQILLEPNRVNGLKPSFSFEEAPKTINQIKPEQIAESICKLLVLEFDYPFETVYFGQFYNSPKMIEMAGSHMAINTQNLGLNSLVVRLDYNFNEQLLLVQSKICRISVVTNTPINLNILKTIKPQLDQLIYIVGNNNNQTFPSEVQKLGINLLIISELSNEELNKYKLDYLDIGPIHTKNITKSLEQTSFKDVPSEKLYFKSNKLTLDRGKIYSTKAHWIQDASIPNVNQEFQPIINNEEFWKELDYYYVVKLK